jgi:hypothetical protein
MYSKNDWRYEWMVGKWPKWFKEKYRQARRSLKNKGLK